MSEENPEPELAPGVLLVAAPMLRDPNFLRTVVFIIDHRADGTTGVVLNRPSQVRVLDVLPQWSQVAAGDYTVFVGGPVETNAALCLARAAPGAEPPGWTHVTGRLGLADLGTEPGLLQPEIEQMRVFAGYAGWGVGQLQSEIDEGAWFVVPALPSDVFAEAAGDLWRAVLRRQSGPLALLSTYPDDPKLN